MAYIDPTVLTAFQQRDPVQGEIRTTNYGLIKAFKESTPNYPISAEARAVLEKAQDIAISIPAIPDNAITTASSESFTIPANLNTSETKTATFYTLFAGFHVYNAMFKDNMIARESYIMDRMKQIDKGMATAKTSTLLTIIDGQKTQSLPNNPVSNDGITYAASTLTCTLAAQQQRIFQNLNVIAEDNGLEKPKIFAVSPGIQVLQNFNDMYGAANTIDLQNQGFIPSIHADNRITNTVRWTGYLMENDAFGVYDNFKWDFVNRTTVGSAKWDVSAQPLPLLGSNVMIYYETDKADATSLMTNTSTWQMTTVEKYGFIHRYAVLTPYNSAIGSKVNPVIKVVGATS